MAEPTVTSEEVQEIRKLAQKQDKTNEYLHRLVRIAEANL
jgi:hypothetical protein